MRYDWLRVLLIVTVVGSTTAFGFEDDDDETLPTIAETIEGFEHREGFLSVYLDHERARVFLEIAPPDDRGLCGELLYVESLRRGLGSNPVGLDRGQLGDEAVVRIRRAGRRVLFERVNVRYRAQTDDAAERRAVEDSFATSVIWGGEIEAIDEDGTALLDLTSFIVRDAHGVSRTLDDSDQGEYALDDGRSAVDLAECHVFPDNVELEALVTFTTTDTERGPHVRSVSPDSGAVTLIQHHSFIRLPDDGYTPRRFDPRVAANAISFKDYAAPLDQPMDVRWITRHRLERVDHDAPRGPAVEPIVYYVDRGAPEPIRTALVEGASWWAAAFEAAGFTDAYRVELMPEGAHPLDVRYNVIQWVHRSTRGWSYGGSIVDPRTGEILKGHVSLGSLRVRQDRLLFEGLLGVEHTGTGRPDDPVEIALARIRQLSAHEVGHTLGFAHNFAASTWGGRASVMDYPAPLVQVTADRRLDLSNAYGVGVGAWDVHCVRYAYTDFPEHVAEGPALYRIVREGLDAGMVFMSDDDARPSSSSHPAANLWDNGSHTPTALRQTLEARRIALESFGERNIATGRPRALLEEVLAPLYFHHRYQVDAVVKSVGGIEYAYTLRDDAQPNPRSVTAREQRDALEALLDCLEPKMLDLDDSVLDVMTPRPFGYDDNRELFDSRMTPHFDPVSVAATAADIVIGGLLDPARAARCVEQHRRDGAQLSFGDVTIALIEHAFPDLRATGRQLPIQVAIQEVLVTRLMDLASDESASTRVRAEAEASLERIKALARPDSVDDRAMASRIARFLERGIDGARDGSRPLDPPPGSPIGLGECSQPPW